jgi:serine 3-dehydrogenase
VYPKGAVYCGSKFAERAITEGLRLDLLGTGVRACTVDPGMVETELSLVSFHWDDARASRVYDGMTPLAADDVARAIAWVLDQPRHVNVAEVVLYPTDQASPTLVHRRSPA